MTSTTSTYTDHEWALCHDHRHDDFACPACGGWLATCIDPRCEHLADHVRAKMRKITGDLPQTPSAIVATAEDTGAPGEGVETPPPSPPRPDALPEKIAVDLPVTARATAHTHRGHPFQPDTVRWEAFRSRFDVIVTAWVHGCDTTEHAAIYAEADRCPDWVPAQPAWFAEQVARMRRAAAQDAWDVRLEKLIDRANEGR